MRTLHDCSSLTLVQGDLKTRWSLKRSDLYHQNRFFYDINIIKIMNFLVIFGKQKDLIVSFVYFLKINQHKCHRNDSKNCHMKSRNHKIGKSSGFPIAQPMRTHRKFIALFPKEECLSNKLWKIDYFPWTKIFTAIFRMDDKIEKVGYLVLGFFALKIASWILSRLWVFGLAKPVDFSKFGEWAVITGGTGTVQRTSNFYSCFFRRNRRRICEATGESGTEYHYCREKSNETRSYEERNYWSIICERRTCASRSFKTSKCKNKI